MVGFRLSWAADSTDCAARVFEEVRHAQVWTLRGGDRHDQSRAKVVMCGIIVDLAKEAVTCGGKRGDEVRLTDEASRSNVPDSRL